MDGTLVAAIIAGGVALAGYVITYLNNIRLSQRTERLARINRQLSEFYGPLYSIVDTGNRVWEAFREKYPLVDPNLALEPGYEPSDPDYDASPEECEAWRLWMSTVFMPQNLQVYELVISKADLLIETDIPDCLKKLCAHIAVYKTLLKRWEDNDFSEHFAPIGYRYPGKELIDYCHEAFKKLKEKQEEIIRQVGR